ncbi:MATE family efflux transporter [Paraburkholderia bonniea]|uniref:MATE family efflux transporter n=1 Tax=Paraburkholderia bonniea TaxID=2152891 RepID=UPI0015805626|nr:MATE family efflux transporter [Paraburkholderia bonniea]WJF91516.1 MATE family efflux transporter [Paraburkholderia bonniea]WJF94835.1 MATE family efflux transporter [Paraburkholderia bonniea]
MASSEVSAPLKARNAPDPVATITANGWLAEFRGVWRLLYPMLVSTLASYCLNLFDYHWIRHLGAADLALLALMNGSVMSFMFLLSKSFEESFVALFARAAPLQQGVLLQQALWLALCIGAGVVGLLLWAQVPLVHFLSGGVLSGRHAGLFYTVMVATFALTLVNTVLSAALRVYGDAKTPARISVSCGVLNNLLDPLMIFGVFGHAPAWQIFGLAAASWGARVTYLLLSSVSLRKRLRREQVCWPRLRPVWPLQQRLLRLFVPSALLEALTFCASVMVYAAIATYGVQVIGGYGVGFELLVVGFILVKGLSMVFMIRLGHRLRQGLDLHTCARSVLVLGTIFVILISAGYFGLRGWVLPFLVSDPAASAIALAWLNYAPIFIASYLLSNLVTGCCQLLERPAWALWLGLFFSWVVNLGAVSALVQARRPVAEVFATMASISAARALLYLVIFPWLVRRLAARANGMPLLN